MRIIARRARPATWFARPTCNASRAVPVVQTHRDGGWMRSIVSLSFVLATMSVTTVATAAPVTEVPNPLALYPRRPGAKFEDIEARPHAVVRVEPTLALDVSLERWTREPLNVVPAGWYYAHAGELEHANHADGFVLHPA